MKIHLDTSLPLLVVFLEWLQEFGFHMKGKSLHSFMCCCGHVLVFNRNILCPLCSFPATTLILQTSQKAKSIYLPLKSNKFIIDTCIYSMRVASFVGCVMLGPAPCSANPL